MNIGTNDIDTHMENIQNILNIYKSDPYILNYIHTYLNNLSQLTIKHKEEHDQRMIRTSTLTNTQDRFINMFLKSSHYFYLKSVNIFYYYDGLNYTITDEDNIYYKILNTISEDRTIMDWKYKTKTTILKKIKEQSLFQSIPETETVQQVLNILTSSCFKSKNMVKYFLTIIGDNILKKTDKNQYLISNKLKGMLNSLETMSYYIIGKSNIFNHFITKYHKSYKYDNIRILTINNTINIHGWENIINNYGLNLLCVACYYSNKHKSAERFLVSRTDIYPTIAYLKTNSIDTIVDNFCTKYIESTNVVSDLSKTRTSMYWKNIDYLWKLFLNDISMPNIIYTSELKEMLLNKYTYDTDTDTFINITSPYLPIISDFISFWDNTMILTDNDQEEGITTCLEIDEICILFKKWSREENTSNNTNCQILESDALRIISHYYTDIIIEDNNSTIQSIRCTLWNKCQEIYDCMTLLETKYKNNEIIDKQSISNIWSFNDLYIFYMNNKSSSLTVNKRYFEKYIEYYYGNDIEYDNYIELNKFFNN